MAMAGDAHENIPEEISLLDDFSDVDSEPDHAEEVPEPEVNQLDVMWAQAQEHFEQHEEVPTP